MYKTISIENFIPNDEALAIVKKRLKNLQEERLTHKQIVRNIH